MNTPHRGTRLTTPAQLPALPYPWYFFAAWLFLGLTYAYGRCQGINYGDAVLFIQAVQNGFNPDTNAGGHFLYINALAAALPLWPWGTLPEKMVWVSVLFGWLSMGQWYRIGYRLCGSAPAAVLAMLLAGLGFTFWREAEIIEVHTPGSFLFSLMLYPLLTDLLQAAEARKNTGSPIQAKAGNAAPLFRRTNETSFFFGLALLLHIQYVLLMPAYLWYLWRSHSNHKRILALLVLTASTSLLWLLPLLLHTHPLKALFFDNLYSVSWLVSTPASVVKQAGAGLFYLLYNYHFYVPVIGIGVWQAFKKQREVTLLLLLICAAFWAYCLRCTGPDVYQFYTVPNLIAALLAADGNRYLLEANLPVKRLLRFGIGPLLALQAFLPLCFYAALPALAAQTKTGKALNDAKAYKGGLQYLMQPSMRRNPGIEVAAKTIYEQKRVPAGFMEFYWNYKPAILYLYHTPDTTDYRFDSVTGRLLYPVLPVYRPSGVLATDSLTLMN